MPDQPPLKNPPISRMPDHSNLPQSSSPNRSGIGVVLIAIIIILLTGAALYYFLVYSKQDEGKNMVNTQVNAVVSNLNNAKSTNTNLAFVVNSNTNSIGTNFGINVNAVINTNFDNLGSLPPREVLDEINDADGDGLLTGVESLYGANPNIADTDGDGFDDLTEVNNCFNPNGDGAMNIALYKSYCMNFFTNHVEEGIINNEAAIALCDLWTQQVQEEITLKIAGESSDAVWYDMDLSEINNVCIQFESQHQVNMDEDGNTICEASLFIAGLFCDQIDYNN
ncbi:hypothetical protein IID19_01695 [Patescibacteria group bacterium]|nr:hypothetical protein [Patescibacteria group bacterium]